MTTTQTLDTNTIYKFASRGIGSSWDRCFVCAEAPLKDGLGEGSTHENLAAFVEGRAGGEAVLALFQDRGLTASLDWRESEPNWVQIKVGVCRAHQASLRLLDRVTAVNDEISSKAIAYCLPGVRTERDHR